MARLKNTARMSTGPISSKKRKNVRKKSSKKKKKSSKKKKKKGSLNRKIVKLEWTEPQLL